MAKARNKRKPRPVEVLELPTIEQLRNGDFVDGFVTHVETGTKAKAYKRRDSSILEKWMTEPNAGLLFPVQAQRFIGDCINLWAQVGSQRVTANYGERIPCSGQYDGMGQKCALDQLHRFKGLLGPYQRHYWSVFENVVRHNEAAGVAGSHFANNPAQRIQSAKLIVSVVATDLAAKLGY